MSYTNENTQSQYTLTDKGIGLKMYDSKKIDSKTGRPKKFLTGSDKINLKDESSSNSVRVLLLLSKPKKLLATILIFNNLINVAIVMISNSCDYVKALELIKMANGSLRNAINK